MAARKKEWYYSTTIWGNGLLSLAGGSTLLGNFLITGNFSVEATVALVFGALNVINRFRTTTEIK